jgi:hypothetical protein
VLFISTFRHKVVLFFIVCCLPSAIGFSQVEDSTSVSTAHLSRFAIGAKDSVVTLPSQFIVEGTDSVWLDSALLRKGYDYLLDLRWGTLKLKRTIPALADTSRKHNLIVRYSALPFTFQPEYRHHEPVPLKDTTTGKTQQLSKSVSTFNMDDIFGSNVEKSGSILRGLSVGSNRDLTVTSGFNMQMSGKIASNVDVTASLTDENIPLQPEGTTQQLQDIDKVFIQVRGTDASATLGDFTLGLAGTEFGNYNRKVEGAEGIGEYRTDFTRGELIISAGTTRGKFTTDQFFGQDAVQGPYVLTGQYNEVNIIVIAGTEKVYIDGEQVVRGEANDYTIDYSTAQITFTPKRLITHVSRITVDFEYTDQQFNRNMFAIQATNSFLNDRVTMQASVIREADDQSSPIGTTLSDTDLTILQNAGANRANAYTPGLDSVGQGKGQYEAFDTTVFSPVTMDSVRYLAYRYAPQDTIHAIYAITFSFVGIGLGDYNQVTIGQYAFVGIHQGGYNPVQTLPIPQSHTVTDFNTTVKLGEGLSIKGEGAYSSFDQNLYSTLSGVTINGGAYNLSMEYAPESLKIGGTNIGKLQIDANDRFLDSNFTPIDRINTIEFNRDWNIEDSSNANEEIREATVKYQPGSSLGFSGEAGRITRGDFFSSDRYTVGGYFSRSGMPSASYTFEVLNSQDDQLLSNTNWLKDSGMVADSLGSFTPRFKYDHEYRLETGGATDTAFGGSYRFFEFTPGLTMRNILGTTLLTEYGWREEDSIYLGNLQKADAAFTQHYVAQFPTIESFTSNLSVTSVIKRYTDEFETRDESNVNSFLVQWHANYSPFNHAIESDWFYDAASERSAKYNRIFESVPIGTGNYVYIGDVNDSHVVSASDFRLTTYDGNYISVLVPSNDYVPVTDLNANTRIRINASRLFSKQSALGEILSPLSTETSVRIAENSTDPDTRDIYFLHFSKFLNDSTTLDGTNAITQDVYLWENDPAFSMRLRFDQLGGYTQYSGENDRSYSREQSVRIRWHLVPEIANQIDASHKIDNLTSNVFSASVRGIVSDGFTSDYSYRPIQPVELGFTFGVTRATNFDTTTANLNNQSVRLAYSFNNKGQVRTQFSREEAILDRAGAIFPYQLTGGLVAGRTWLWTLAFDYKLTQFIQSEINYDGRIENSGAAIHTGRAEVKAFF